MEQWTAMWMLGCVFCIPPPTLLSVSWVNKKKFKISNSTEPNSTIRDILRKWGGKGWNSMWVLNNYLEFGAEAALIYLPFPCSFLWLGFLQFVLSFWHGSLFSSGKPWPQILHSLHQDCLSLCYYNETSEARSEAELCCGSWFSFKVKQLHLGKALTQADSKDSVGQHMVWVRDTLQSPLTHQSINPLTNECINPNHLLKVPPLNISEWGLSQHKSSDCRRHCSCS